MALKIKDNVDLKKLEKFGFDEEEDRYFYYEFTEPDCNSELRLYVDKKSREISTGIDMYASPYRIHDKIYDLIQADLVEKVSKMEVSKEELEAYNWLCALEIHSEAEAIDKEMCLCMLDKYKFKDYFQRKETEKKWKI